MNEELTRTLQEIKLEADDLQEIKLEADDISVLAFCKANEKPQTHFPPFCDHLSLMIPPRSSW
jgi:hypothetical protein